MRVKYWIQTDKVGSKCSDTVEVDEEEWQSMTGAERDEYMRVIAFNYLDWGFEELPPESSVRSAGPQP